MPAGSTSDPFGRERRSRLSRVRLGIVIVVLAGVLVIGAISLLSGDGGRKKAATPAQSGSGDASQPRPAESVERFSERLKAAIESPSCEGFADLHAYAQQGCADVKRRFAGIRFTGSEQYGTGAVLDATAPIQPKGLTFVVALDDARQWRVLEGYATAGPTVERRAKDLIPFDTAARDWVRAARSRDCGRYLRITQLHKRGPAQAVCDSEFNDATRVPPELVRDPSAKPVRLGGNEKFQAYSLRIAPDRYGTLIVVHLPRARGSEAVTVVAGPIFVT